MSIVVSHLYKSFCGRPVIADLSFEIPDRGIVGLSGPSGSGKTTLLRLLAGLTCPDSGTIVGLDPGRVSMVFQEDRLLPWLSAADNIALIEPDCRIVGEWLAKVKLSECADQFPAQLSGGMQRRIALARALARESKLLLLDEPFTGMDAELKAAIYLLIRETALTRPVLLVTHDFADLQQLADVIMLADGPPLTLKKAVSQM